MDKYLIIINQMKEELEVLEQEESELEKELQIAHDKTTELNSDYYCLLYKTEDLKKKKDEAEVRPRNLKRERIEILKDAGLNLVLSLVLISTILKITLTGIALNVIAAAIIGTAYIMNDRKIKKELKKFENINLEEIKEQLEEINELKGEKYNEYSHARQNENNIREQLMAKTKEVSLLNIKILNIEEVRNQVIAEICGDVLDPQTLTSEKPDVITPTSLVIKKGSK